MLHLLLEEADRLGIECCKNTTSLLSFVHYSNAFTEYLRENDALFAYEEARHTEDEFFNSEIARYVELLGDDLEGMTSQNWDKMESDAHNLYCETFNLIVAKNEKYKLEKAMEEVTPKALPKRRM